MNEFELTIQLRNNLLKSKRLALGLAAPALAKRIGVSYSIYNQYESLKKSPIAATLSSMQTERALAGRATGKENLWKPSALKIATFHGVDPAELWPDAVLAVQNPKIVKEVDSERIEAMRAFEVARLPPSPADTLASAERSELLRRLLDELPKNERALLEHRFGLNGDVPMTLEEVGLKFGVQRERARQIEGQALRKLRARIQFGGYAIPIAYDLDPDEP